MTLKDTAFAFFHACETGKGWAECAQYCAPDAVFEAQSDALADIKTAEGYCAWMAGMFGPMPDASYALTGFAVDEDRQTVLASAVFHGTNTGEGPVPPTGQKTASDYAYVMRFSDNKLVHMTKVWNDGWALRELGWA
ncbi:MAG: nuclear transport factor 2 family protein [Pseudomonadota bacterium]